jgi:2-methylcitrate dehydratase PrpD
MRPTGHPGMQVVIPALAAAEAAAVDGRTLLTAVLTGYEVASRLFTGFRLTYPVHPHGHFGAVGGAVAVAVITGADPAEAARIAATSPILSIWEACYDGATARNTWMGSAAQSAVRASALARAGFTGSARAFDIAFGEIAGTLVDREALVAPLDYDRLGILRNYFKLHSACALTHAALDAVISLPRVDPSSTERIVVETVSNNMKLDRQAAPNALSARFSLPYAVAAGAVLGRIDPDTFEYREDIARLAERVEVRVAPDLEAQWPESSPARVTVVAREGTSEVEVQNPHGHHRDPVDAVELRGKFDRLVADPEDAELWWSRLTSLAELPDCSRLFERPAR